MSPSHPLVPYRIEPGDAHSPLLFLPAAFSRRYFLLDQMDKWIDGLLGDTSPCPFRLFLVSSLKWREALPPSALSVVEKLMNGSNELLADKKRWRCMGVAPQVRGTRRSARTATASTVAAPATTAGRQRPSNPEPSIDTLLMIDRFD